MDKELLKIENLEVTIENKLLLKKLNLSINQNETHVIMGPNGSGKSTLSKVLAGHPSYKVQKGHITFCNKNLLKMSPEERSHCGLFLAFQYPIEISGVTNYEFLRIAYNEKQKYINGVESDPLQFMEQMQNLLKKLHIGDEFLIRNLNEGFSGGEKKRNEILQLLLLKPKLVILDEIDSGLDIDALQIACEGIKENLPKNSSILLITHYPRILRYLKPTYVHILIDGKITKTGGMELVYELEKKGYQSMV